MSQEQTILITGGTGLVGTRLSDILSEKGYDVIHLSRKKNLTAKYPAYQWDLKNEKIDGEAIKKADYIVHLAGAGVAEKRWTNSRKQLILDSRIKSTQLLKKAIETYNPTLKGFISASAVGFYGNTGDTLLTETSPKGKGFLAEVVEKWESAIDEITMLNIRVTKLRIGIVLSTKGGALAQMLPSYKVNVGAYFGNGKQYYSWIHIDDLVNMFIKSIEDANIQGIYNAVAPNPVRNKTLAYKIAEARNQKALIAPTPAFGLRLALGEMADAVLFSNKVAAQKILNTGFHFQFPTILPALKHLIEQKI